MDESADSPVNRFTAADEDRSALFDIKVTYQRKHTDFEVMNAPKIFTPEVGPYQVVDLNNVFSIHPDYDIFDERGISRDGAVVIVRPDQYGAHVLPLGAREELTDFFAGVFNDAD